MVDAPVTNNAIQLDIKIVREVVTEFSAKYRPRVLVHPTLSARTQYERKVGEPRVKRYIFYDLTNII